MTMITNKYQLILAHQQYGDPAVLRNIANDMKLVFKKLSQPVIVRYFLKFSKYKIHSHKTTTEDGFGWVRRKPTGFGF